jgi:hypothetical protein
MARKLALPILLASALLGGCVGVHAVPIGSPVQLTPVPPEQVVVYRSEDEVDAPYDRIAVLYVEGDADFTNERQMVGAARKKAGRLGANAVVLGEFREPGTGARVVGALFHVSLNHKTQLLAIRIRPAPSGEPASPADSTAAGSR